jgi:aspartate/methionine/tyrosine aminotransferase
MINVRGPQGEHRGRQFVLDLIREYNLTVTPGIGFGSVAADYVRISLAAPDDDLTRGVRAICELANRSYEHT